MGGGLMQLVAYGAQDVYLTGNPQITFFKVVYRRHTNFSMECIRQTVSGALEEGKKATATIARNGDLIGQIYMSYMLKLPTGDTFYPNSNFGNCIIRNAEVEIGGQLIDRQDGRFMQMYADVTQSNPTLNPCGSTKYQKLTGTGVNMSEIVGSKSVNQKYFFDTNTTSCREKVKYWIPLQFWFCRNPGLSLPLIALQYHEVKVSIELEEAYKLCTKYNTGTSEIEAPSPGDVTTLLFSGQQELWVDYIYLDTDERRRFAQVSHEYLIEQVQIKKQNLITGNTSVDLNFNHPVKELLWVITGDTSNNLYSGFFPGVAVDNVDDMFDTVDQEEGVVSATPVSEISNKPLTGVSFKKSVNFQLKLNGQDRFEKRDSFYFTNTQVNKYHTGSGSAFPVGSVHVYSFALKPEEHQPSGTCNFSRIDSSKLDVIDYEANNLTTSEINVYAINYNVLRIMSGMGGLAYSN